MFDDPIYFLKKAAQHKLAAKVQMEDALKNRSLAAEYRDKAQSLYSKLSLKEQQEFDEVVRILDEEYNYHG